MNEICLVCRYCEIIESGAKGFLGESVFKCRICEEETADKTLCFEPKEDDE